MLRDWLIRRAIKARVRMCAKEVKWDLEQSAPERRATILALSHAQVGWSDTAALQLRKLADDPASRSYSELSSAYRDLESIRNILLETLRLTRQNQKRAFGYDLPDQLVQHNKNLARGLELWMICVGVGIEPRILPDALRVWSTLSSSAPHVSSAIDSIQLSLLETFGMKAPMLDIDKDEWLAAATQIPAFAARR